MSYSLLGAHSRAARTQGKVREAKHAGVVRSHSKLRPLGVHRYVTHWRGIIRAACAAAASFCSFTFRYLSYFFLCFCPFRWSKNCPLLF